MEDKLISYYGLDNIFEYDTDKSYPYKVDGILYLDNDINNILSFSVKKECLSYKLINIFENTNLSNEEFFGNLIIMNNKFDLSFEYSKDDNFSKLNIISKTIYDSNIKSLDEFNISDLDITLSIKDLFCKKLSNNELYYCINLNIFISKI